MKADVKVELTGAIKKTKALKNLPKATRFQLEDWGSKFERYLKEVAVTGRYVGRYKTGRRTSQLKRKITHRISKMGDVYKLEVGTVGSKYARILEKGGTIRAKNKMTFKRKGKEYRFKNGPYLFIPIGKGSKLSFRLKKQVKIPAFHWLEKSLRDRKGKLDRMLDKPLLYRVAERMK